MAIRIGINGFGRIGRQVYRAIRERYDNAIDVVAVNDIGRIKIMSHLLKYDSTYGRFPGDVVAGEDGFFARGDEVTALSRLASAGMLLLTAAAGLAAVIAVVGFSVESSSPTGITKPLMLILSIGASFCGGCGFAILYNGTRRQLLYVGMIAVIGNVVRLSTHASGLRLPLSTFLGALTVGLTASLVGRWI